MLQPQRHAGSWPAVLAALLLLLAGTVPILGSDCLILDGKIPDNCLKQPQSNTQQLVTVKVPLDLRVQWGQAHGYCGEVAVQMIAAHHGVWVGQQLVRDMNKGELLVDDMGSVEALLDTLGFSHASWKVPGVRRHFTAVAQDYSRHAELFLVWMKQNIAQGRVPIFGAKIDGEHDHDYDHIMPAYSMQFWSNSSSSSSKQTGSSSSRRTAAAAINSVSNSTGGEGGAQAAAAGLSGDSAEAAAVTASLSHAAVAAPAAAIDGTEASGSEGDATLLETGSWVDSPAEGANADAPHTAQQEAPSLAKAVHTAAAPSRMLLSSESARRAKAAPVDPDANLHATGWLPPAGQNPDLAALPGLYSFSTSDVMGWTNDYGADIQRAASAPGFFATRASCRRTDVAGGCISTDSPSYAVAMGGLVQPPDAAAAAAGGGGGVGAGAAASVVTAAAAQAGVEDEGEEGEDGTWEKERSASGATGHTGVQHNIAAAHSMAAPHTLFRPLRLVITAWSKGNYPVAAEPLARLRASATGYQLDVSRCAPQGQPFTVFRFDGYRAFRSTGQVKTERRYLVLPHRTSVLENPKSVQELSARCTAAKQACRRATFVQSAGLSVGAKDFGAFSAYSATYFACVSGAVGGGGASSSKQ